MIIVNYFQSEDYNPLTDGYTLTLAAVVNDTLDLIYDIDDIKETIENSHQFNPVNGAYYELHLDRAIIRYSHPASERTFSITKIERYDYSQDLGYYKPMVDLT